MSGVGISGHTKPVRSGSALLNGTTIKSGRFKCGPTAREPSNSPPQPTCPLLHALRPALRALRTTCASDGLRTEAAIS
jgi:hypothetical protein